MSWPLSISLDTREMVVRYVRWDRGQYWWLRFAWRAILWRNLPLVSSGTNIYRVGPFVVAWGTKRFNKIRRYNT